MAMCRMWCLSVPEGLTFFHASRPAAFMHIGYTSARVEPENLSYVRHTGYSTASSCVSWKDIEEKSLNLNSMLRKVFSSMAADRTHKNKVFVHTCKHICQYENSVNTYMNRRIVLRHFSVCTAACKEKQDNNTGMNSDTEDQHIKAALDSVTPSIPPPNFVDIVPGKGPPPEPPVDCCMSGCANCVWIQYAEELKTYYSLDEGSDRAKKAIEQIENPGLQMFLKLELGLL